MLQIAGSGLTAGRVFFCYGPLASLSLQIARKHQGERVELALGIASFYYANPAQPATSLRWYSRNNDWRRATTTYPTWFSLIPFRRNVLAQHSPYHNYHLELATLSDRQKSGREELGNGRLCLSFQHSGYLMSKQCLGYRDYKYKGNDGNGISKMKTLQIRQFSLWTESNWMIGISPWLYHYGIVGQLRGWRIVW